jgi:hypothetical protein
MNTRMSAHARMIRSVVSAAALCVAAAPALADPSFTTVTPHPSELNHHQILHNIYGGAWSLSGNDYTSGSLSAIRIADFGFISPLEASSGASSGVNDQTWAGQSIMLTARAKNAGDNSHFGWIDDTQAIPAFVPLFNTGSIGASSTIVGSASFRWALKDLTMNTLFTSLASDNLDTNSIARDQLVTYRINGLNTSEAVYLLCWEDRIYGKGSADYDYNDSVIELRATLVPAPGAAAVFGLAGLLARRRR